MFKKILSVSLFVFLICLVSLPSFAEEKIALVSLQRALNEVNEGKQAKTTLKKDYDGKKKQIDSMKTDFDQQAGQLEKERLVLSQDAYKQKTQDLQKKYLDYQNKTATFLNELRTAEADSAQKIIEALRALSKKMAMEQGYTLLIENSADTVLFSKSAEDITDKLIAAYNGGKR